MRKLRTQSAVRLAALMLLGATCIGLAPAAVAQSTADSFDSPLRHRVVDLGRSPNNNGHSKLTCDYFPSFMVKQLDLGEEGADWFAIVPSPPERVPACTRRLGPAEKVIRGRDWCGYFQGAKDGYVFLNACDAYNGGLDFAVYDAATGQKVFQDTAMDFASQGLVFSRAPDGKISLNYSRVVVFDCTLPRDQAGCWSQIQSKLGLSIATPPACTAYEPQMTGSVIAYPVEVDLSAEPKIHPLPGPIRCRPPE